MDAKVYGALTKPQKISNDFGVSGGGPVRVPWLYNGKDKTFFFGAYEGLRFPRGQTIQNTAPTQAMRNGDFSGLANVTVRDPLTGAAFQGNRIPDNRISSISKQILSLYPLPNVSNPDQFRVANYIRNASNNFPFNGLPNIDFSGDITDLSRNRADGQNQSRTLQFNNNLTWTQGSHTMKYGIDLRWIRAVSPLGFIGADNYGNSSFNNTFSGYDFGDFLLGIPIRTSFAIIQQDNDGRTTHYHFFGQDSFRVNQRLTLEFGLRYEFHPAYTDAGGNIGNFDTSVPKSGRVVYPTGKRNLLAPGFLATFNACPVIRLAAALACRATSIQTASATATFRTRRPICGLT